MLITDNAKTLANFMAYEIAKGRFVDESPEGVNRWCRGLNFYDLQTLRKALFAASTVDHPLITFLEINGVAWALTNRVASRWDRVAAFRRVCNAGA
jgi:hypothetical protein